MSVNKAEVLDGLSKTKKVVENLVDSLAQLINETEKDLEGLMKRGWSDFSLIHHINRSSLRAIMSKLRFLLLCRCCRPPPFRRLLKTCKSASVKPLILVKVS